VTAHTNYGKTSTAERNNGRNPKRSERDRRILKRTVFKNHRTTAGKVTAEPNIHREDPVSTKKKKAQESFTNPTFTVEMQLLKF